jgi:hypothetical protein
VESASLFSGKGVICIVTTRYNDRIQTEKIGQEGYEYVYDVRHQLLFNAQGPSSLALEFKQAIEKVFVQPLVTQFDEDNSVR